MSDTGVEVDHFWHSLAEIIRDFAPKNATLLNKRDALQQKIDAWHIKNRSKKHDTSVILHRKLMIFKSQRRMLMTK